MAEDIEEAATAPGRGDPRIHERYQQILGEVDDDLARAADLDRRI